MKKQYSMTRMVLALGAITAMVALIKSPVVGRELKSERATTGVAGLLEGKLVKPDAGSDFKPVSLDAKDAPEYYAVYFSAHWCGPCRAFTPELVKFYESRKARGANFEVIFVSRDHNQKAMHEYMTEARMPWPALNFSDRESTTALSRHAGPGIPCLVILDAEGKVVAHSFRDGDYLGPVYPLQVLDKLLENDRAPSV